MPPLPAAATSIRAFSSADPRHEQLTVVAAIDLFQVADLDKCEHTLSNLHPSSKLGMPCKVSAEAEV